MNRPKINRSTVLTIASCLGVIGTAIVSSKAGIRASRALKQANFEPTGDFLKDSKEKFKITAKEYLLTDAIAIGTCALIVANTKITRKQVASIATCAALSGRLLDEYKAKIKEDLGPEAYEKIRAHIAKDHEDGIAVATNPKIFCDGIASVRQDIDYESSDELFYDEYNDKWFWSNLARVKTAEYHLNRNFVMRGSASLGELYEFLGLDPDEWMDEVGWGQEFLDGGCTWIDFELQMSDREDGQKYYIWSPTFCPEPFGEEDI